MLLLVSGRVVAWIFLRKSNIFKTCERSLHKRHYKEIALENGYI